jgi:hypothetical protein
LRRELFDNTQSAPSASLVNESTLSALTDTMFTAVIAIATPEYTSMAAKFFIRAFSVQSMENIYGNVMLTAKTVHHRCIHCRSGIASLRKL